MGLLGSLDRGIPPVKSRVFETCMNAFRKSVDIEIYDGAGHAFENPANKCSYRPEAAANAWFRTLKFFDQAKELKSPVS